MPQQQLPNIHRAHQISALQSQQSLMPQQQITASTSSASSSITIPQQNTPIHQQIPQISQIHHQLQHQSPSQTLIAQQSLHVSKQQKTHTTSPSAQPVVEKLPTRPYESAAKAAERAVAVRFPFYFQNHF